MSIDEDVVKDLLQEKDLTLSKACTQIPGVGSCKETAATAHSNNSDSITALRKRRTGNLNPQCPFVYPGPDNIQHVLLLIQLH